MKVSEIRHNDYNDFQKLHYATFGHAPAVNQIRAFLNKGEIFVAKDPNGVIGFVTAAIENDGTPIITWIAVQESARGTGVGRRLLGELEHAYPAKGLADVPVAFRDSIGFFLACGFHMFSLDPNHAVLRRDLTVDSPTLDRLESFFGQTTTKKPRRRKHD